MDDRTSLVFSADQAIDQIDQPFRATVKQYDSRKSQVVGTGSVYPSLQHGEGLSTTGGALAIVSTIIGGGIVGLPFALLTLGLVAGILLNISVCYITFLSGILYLSLRELIPGRPNSLYEIGYMLQGRKSIFLVATIQTINSFGLMMIYFIVFSETASQLVSGFTGQPFQSVWYTSKYFYVLVLGIGLGPVIVKKELAELEWLSILLGVSILIFVVLSLVCLFFIPDFPKATNPFDAAIWPEGKWSTISSLCTIMVAYAYQQNVFPVYDALKDQSIAGYKAASTLGLLFSIVVYFLVAIIGVALFGSALSSSVLFNFGEVSNSNGNPFWESTIIQISFMIVLLCHIPFIFYGGKEGLCIIVDEAQRKSISNVLWHKLQANESFARATQTESAPNPELKIPFEAAFEDQVEAARETVGSAHIKEQALKALSIVPQAQANRMAYKDMNLGLYLLTTFLLYGVEMLGAILIEDISTVFEFASAFAVTALAFWFPAGYYLMAEKKYSQEPNPTQHLVAQLFIFVGIFNCFVGVFAGVLNVITHSGGH